MNIEAVLKLLRERERTNGWAEWDEICATAGVEMVPLAELSYERVNEFVAEDGRRYGGCVVVEPDCDAAKLMGALIAYRVRRDDQGRAGAGALPRSAPDRSSGTE